MLLPYKKNIACLNHTSTLSMNDICYKIIYLEWHYIGYNLASYKLEPISKIDGHCEGAKPA